MKEGLKKMLVKVKHSIFCRMLEAKKTLDEKQKKLTDLETYLDSKDHLKWKEVIPYLITFHVNYKEDVFGAKKLEIATKLNLKLVCVEDIIQE